MSEHGIFYERFCYHQLQLPLSTKHQTPLYLDDVLVESTPKHKELVKFRNNNFR